MLQKAYKEFPYMLQAGCWVSCLCFGLLAGSMELGNKHMWPRHVLRGLWGPVVVSHPLSSVFVSRTKMASELSRRCGIPVWKKFVTLEQKSSGARGQTGVDRLLSAWTGEGTQGAFSKHVSSLFLGGPASQCHVDEGVLRNRRGKRFPQWDVWENNPYSF